MRLESGYLLYREGKTSSSGGLAHLSPSRTAWVVLEQPNVTTVRLKFYNSRDDFENSNINNGSSNKSQQPFRAIDFNTDEGVCVSTRCKGAMFRLLRTRLAANSFEGVVEHVIDEFEPISSTTTPASQWVKAILTAISPLNVQPQKSVINKPEILLPPAATSTPRARRQHSRISNNNNGNSGDSAGADSSNVQNDVFSTSSNKSSSDISGIVFDPDSTNQQSLVPGSQRQQSSSAASSGVASSIDPSSTNVSQLLELVQTQRAELARLERLLNSSGGNQSSESTSINNNSNNRGSNSGSDLSQNETEILRLQKIILKYRNKLCAVNSGKSVVSTAEKYKWRQAYIQSIISAMKIVVLEQRSVEKLELGLASIDLHAANIQTLLSEAELPSLQKLAADGRYVDDFGFVHKFTSSDPHSADILNFAAGLLMDHFSAQTSYSTENETFWKILIDNNKPLNETALESALFHRRYLPERMRPDIWRLLLQNEVQAARSKHRTDYYSLLARSAGFFGDLEADSSFLDSALTLLTGGNTSPGALSPFDETGGSGISNFSSILEDSTSSANNAVRRQILVDIRRTLPNNIHFGREGRGLTNLYRVLVSFARHKPQLGYCQGINFIAAVLLLLLDNEEEVFWCLVVLTENDRFFGSRQFDSRLTGARADQKLIVNLMSKYLPLLHRHIEKHGTDLSTCFIPWLMCGFYDCVPFRTLLRIWDYFFMAGYSVFYRVAVALMKVQEQSLLEITDPTLILKHIKLFPHLCHDFTHLLKVAFEDLQASEPWPSWDDLLNQRRKNIKSIEKQDVAASVALRRRRTPTKTSSSSNSSTSNAGPTFVTIVEADKCPDVLSASSRLFVWVDDPVSTSSLLYLISIEKSPSLQNDPNSSIGDVLSTTTMPGFPTNETPIIATASLLTRLNGQLVLTFTQFRHNRALISTVQSTSLACLDLESGRIIWSFVPSSANEDDLIAATLLDSKFDIIYVITQFGTILVLQCSELAAIKAETNSNSVDPQQLATSAFRLLTASPITCAAILSFSDTEQMPKSILLLGAGSFVYRVELDYTPDRTPLQVAKIHIPLARNSDSDIKKAVMMEDDPNEISSVRQIVPGQTSFSADKEMLFWWALCDGSPCLVLYAMHKSNPLQCQILTTLSGTSCSLTPFCMPFRASGLLQNAKNMPQPNCILLLPRPPPSQPVTEEHSQQEEAGLSFTSDGNNNGSVLSSTTQNSNLSTTSSGVDGEGLLVGWPNGSIFQWQINTDKLNSLLAGVPKYDQSCQQQVSSSFNNSSDPSLAAAVFPCDCGCVIQPSISMLPTAPKSFQVQLTFQKGAPFASDSDNEVCLFVNSPTFSNFLKSPSSLGKSGKNILSAVRKALLSTFMPSLSKNKPPPAATTNASVTKTGSVPLMTAPIGRFMPTRQSRRMNSRNNSFLYSTKITSSDQQQQPGDSSVDSNNKSNSSQQPVEPLTTGAAPFSSTTFTVIGNRQLTVAPETPSMSAASTPVTECKLNNCFRLVSVSNVFRSDCPVNTMSITQSQDLGKYIWAFQLEWLASKETAASSQQLVGILPVDEDLFQKGVFDESELKKNIFTPKTPLQLASCFFTPPQNRSEGWRTLPVTMKTIADNKQ